MSKYPSKYSNGKLVSCAQYITEIICEKKAKKDKKDLHYRFWLSKEWAYYYKNQIASAHKLLNKYNELAVVKSLSNPKSTKIYSLRAPHLIAIIEEEQKILDAQNKTLSIKINRNNNVIYNRSSKSHTQNVISKLKELE